MKIFINYRREDEANIAFAIANSLMKEFGVENVFFDKQAIQAGSDFPKEINKALENCLIFIPIIGKKWLGIMKKRQVFEKNDYVLNEIEHALEKGVFVLPILVDDTSMPSVKDLPPKLGRLSSINAVNISSNPKHLPGDIKLLIVELNDILSRSTTIRRSPSKEKLRKPDSKIENKKWYARPFLWLPIILVALISITGIYFLRQKSGDLESSDLTAMEKTAEEYAVQVIKNPFLVVSQKDSLKSLAQKIEGNRKIENKLPRSAAIFYRLYAASILITQSESLIDQIQKSLPWLQKSLGLYTGFKDTKELKVSEKFFNDLVTGQIKDIDAEIFFRHNIRVAMIDATEEEVNIMAKQMVKNLITTKKEITKVKDQNINPENSNVGSLTVDLLIGSWSWNQDKASYYRDGTGLYEREGKLCYKFNYMLIDNILTKTADREHACGGINERFQISIEGDIMTMVYISNGFQTKWVRVK